MIASELPQLPWQKVAIDLFEMKGQKYLLLVDYFSRFIEVARLTSTTSQAVINHLKSIFGRHGIPETLISDNGPQFSASEFANFASEYGFTHVTSSPLYPQSNGEIERAVATVKSLLQKSKDPYMAMLAYRSTPLEQGYSPAELQMSRKLRTNIPITQEQLTPKLVDCKQLRAKDSAIKERQRHNYDQRHGVHTLPPLQCGDKVWIPDRKEEGTVVDETGQPRSYMLSTPTSAIRRNRRHVNQLPQPSSDPETPAEPPPEKSPVTKTAPVTETPEPDLVVTTRSGRVVKTPARFKTV